MPAYNAGKYIDEAIESVQNQTYLNWELIIVDDGSKDNTSEVIKKYSEDKRIKYIWQKNGKQGKARNTAILNSKGDYLAFLDADDVWFPDKLKKQLEEIKRNSVDLIFGYSFLLIDGKKTLNKIGRGNGKLIGQAAIDFLLLEDAFIISTVLVNKEKVISVNGFTELLDIQYCEDWHLWLKLAFTNCSFYTNSDVVSYYRLSESSACAVESDAKIKLCNALLDLNLIYPNRRDLITETKKRVNLAVFNSVFFDEIFIQKILNFHPKINYNPIIKVVLKIAYRINIYFFRKSFLLFAK